MWQQAAHDKMCTAAIHMLPPCSGLSELLLLLLLLLLLGG
jgi:hypothetical protein